MKIISSTLRISLVGLTLVGIGIIFIDPLGAQFEQIHAYIESFGSLKTLSYSINLNIYINLFYKIFILTPITAVSTFILSFFTIVVQDIADPDGQVVIDVLSHTFIITEEGDPRIQYDQNLIAVILPIYLLTLVFGYISNFIAILVIWFIVSIVIWLILTLLIDLSIGTVESTSYNTANASSDGNYVTTGINHNFTSIFRGDTSCSECNTDLSEYDDPSYCPNCGCQTLNNR